MSERRHNLKIGAGSQHDGPGYRRHRMVHALLDAGERVVVLDNLATGFDWAVAQGALLVIGDAGNQQLVATLIAKHRVDAIIHFAASVVVEDSVRDPLSYHRNNTVNSRTLIETTVALTYLRRGGEPVTLNCGYGRGFSVLEVIETVKRISGVDFKVELTGRRPGDPAQVMAASDRARALLKWQPHFDDLRTIVCHVLAWERKLFTHTS